MYSCQWESRGYSFEAEGPTLVVAAALILQVQRQSIRRQIMISDYQAVELAALADIWPQTAGNLPTPHQPRITSWRDLFTGMA